MIEFKTRTAREERVLDALRRDGTVVVNAHWRGKGSLVVENPHSVIEDSWFESGARVRRPHRRRRAGAALAAVLLVELAFAIFVHEREAGHARRQG